MAARERILRRINSRVSVDRPPSRNAAAMPLPLALARMEGNDGHLASQLRLALEAVEQSLGITLVPDEEAISLADVRSRLATWQRRQTLRSDGSRSPSPTSRAPVPSADSLAVLQRTIQTLETDNAALRTEIAQHAATEESHRARLTQQEAEIARLSRENAKLVVDYDAQTLAHFTATDTTNQAAAAREQDRDATIAQLRDELAELASHNEQLEIQNEQLRKTLVDTKDRLIEANDARTRHHAEMHETATNLAAANDMMHHLAHQNQHQAEARASHDDATAALTRERARADRVESKLAEVKDQLVQADRKYHQATEELKQAHVREEQVKRQLHNSETDRRRQDNDLMVLRSKLEKIKVTAHARDEELFLTKQLLDAREQEAKDAAARYHKTFGEKDQLATLRRDLEMQLNQARSERDKHITMLRHRDHELAECRTQLRVIGDDLSELKHQHQLLYAVKQRLETEKKEAESQRDSVTANLRGSEDALKQARKDLETATMRLMNTQDQLDKVQRKLQDAAQRLELHTRDHISTKQIAEAREKQLATLELQYKQVLADNRDVDHRVKSLDTRLTAKTHEVAQLQDTLKREQESFTKKLSHSIQHVHEIDQQLVQCKTQMQLVTDERNRLVQENKRLVHKLEKHAQHRTSVEDKLGKALEIKCKLERKTRELHKYKAMYQNILEMGLGHERDRRELEIAKTAAAVAVPAPRSDAAARDLAKLRGAVEECVERGRQLVQSMAAYTKERSPSLPPTPTSPRDGSSDSALMTVFDTLETMAFALCRQASQRRTSSTAHPASPANDSSISDTSTLSSSSSVSWRPLTRQLTATVDRLRTILPPLVQSRLIDDEGLHDLDLAARALRELSGADATATTTFCSVVRCLEALLRHMAATVQAKYADVVAQAQQRAERDVKAQVAREVDGLRNEITSLRGQLVAAKDAVDRQRQSASPVGPKGWRSDFG
ncbi:hypothetical protein AMAG_08148 [Allomyces macrogynus ATCC 38327]|uniref:Uncharacterized protein n=1 Tax=Allomyces macrogynus (strain ATCC 38327) TaxID=578462 RepID=A0A0L0SKG9_ALLM3|nr:hypothetical protein AMAG_08148 [Allomyces macrogynus ATCC 38327]|eukprot:KNE62977.1 hypothetical protein AMAG_08148 [Allomyces macrogynus ATCC 38327]